MKKDTSTNLSYIGKEVFVGIDVHKKSYTIVVSREGEIIKKWTMKASPQNLVKQLLKYFSGATIYSAYEAGFSGFALHRELEKNGIDNIVVNAASMEIASNNRVKTDKRDARKLSTLLEAKRLKGIRVPSEEEEAHRLLSRTRKQLVSDRTSVKNKIRMKFHQFGLIDADENRQMTLSLTKELLKSVTSEELKLVIQSYMRVWESLDKEIKKLEAELKKQAKEDPNDGTYRSAPGVGSQSARILSNELGDMSQFKNERQIFSYTGLTPSEFSSGENVSKGHITHQGNKFIRCVLIEVAWRALDEDPELARFFNSLFPRTGKKKAIVAVARKLIGRIRAAFRKGEKYQVGYPCPSIE